MKMKVYENDVIDWFGVSITYFYLLRFVAYMFALIIKIQFFGIFELHYLLNYYCF